MSENGPDEGAETTEAAEGGGEPEAVSTEDKAAKLAELDERLAKLESQKRWSDYIRALMEKGDLVDEPAEKIELFSKAGTLYIERSSNQAEAIKAFERVLEVDELNSEALARLHTMYEKRRDWESLIRVRKAETQLLDEDDRALAYVEIAQQATEKLRKPEICIELWDQVLTVDPEYPDALAALAQLHERARNWEPLAAVLEKQIAGLTEEKELKQQLNKLGMIYADKVGDDAGAVRAFQQLLTIDPNDRRAQEQLKRRYAALKAWDELEAFYATTEKWDELIRVFEREADKDENSDEERISLLFRAANLWEVQKDKPERAARAYEKVLALDDSNLRAAEALSPIYEGAKDAKKLVRVYEVRLRHLDQPEDRIQLLREMARLYEERLRDKSTAFEKLLEAFPLDPSQEPLQDDLERLAPELDGWERLVESYDRAIRDSQDEGLSLALQMKFGRVLVNVERVEDAIAQFRSVYDAQGDHPEAIEALSELYRQTGRHRELLEMFERRADLEADPDVRRALAYERAALLQEELEATDDAITAYRGILETWGDGESEAYRALDSLYGKTERYPELAETLQRRIDLGPESDEELAALKFRLARVLEQHLDEKIRAVDLYREVLTLMPEHIGARGALEALLKDREVGSYSAEILEPIYETAGEWDSLVGALRVLHQASQDPAQRLALMTKIGEVYGEQIGDPEKCFAAFGEALREDPGSAETLQRLEEVALSQNRFADFVQLLGDLAAVARDPDLARRLWVKAAQTSDTQLDDVDGAISAYMKIIADDPTDEAVLRALEELYQRTERWNELQGILRKRAELESDDGAKEELLLQTALIFDTKLNAPDDAISAYKEILSIDPSSPRALLALDELYERQERWSDLADNVDRQLTMATDPETEVALVLRLAELRESKMGQLDAAIEGYREVLDRDPANANALACLERLIDNEQHQLHIANVLEGIYRDAGQFPDLIRVHEIQANHAGAPERKVELLHQVAELYEVALDDPGKAFETFSRALAVEPANESTQEQLARTAAITTNYTGLAEVYEAQVERVEDPHLKAQLHMKGAAVREDQLQDTERAIQHYQAVLELDEHELRAASSLERLFQLTERYPELAAIYLRKAEMLSAPDEQKEFLFRAAAIYEEILSKPDDAIAVYKRVLDVDGEDVDALDKLVELYLKLERWDALLEVYQHKSEVVVGLDEKKRILVEMGAVYEREVNDVERAIDTYQRILEIDPEDFVAIGRLDALYQQAGNWRDLLSVLEREADLASDPNEVISYRYRIADLWHHRLSDPERAIEIFREILEVAPEHRPTLQALEKMVEESVEPLAAASVLEPIYQQTQEWGRLVQVYEVEVRHEPDPLRKVELLNSIAELQETALGSPQDAFDAFARAVPLDNENEHTLASLERLAEQLGRWNDVANLYDQELGRVKQEDPDLLIPLALRNAQILEVQLGNTEAAIERYQLVLGVDEGHMQAIEALDRLYEASEQWPELADTLRKEMAAASSPDAILAHQFRLGQVFQERLGMVDEAIDQYREILAVAPEHDPALGSLELLFANGIKPLAVGEILEPLYRMNEQWDRLLSVHETQLQYRQDSGERVVMMHQIAEIAEDRAVDPDKAFVWMQRALLEDPTHDHTLSEVERLATGTSGWGQLANTYADVLSNGCPKETKLSVGKSLARLYEEELADIERCEETYRFLLGVDDSDEETLEALDRVYTEYAAHEALSEVLRKRIAASDHPDDQVLFNYRLGSVLENDLGRTDEAIGVFNHVLSDLEPNHTESIEALERIYTKREDWPNLFQTLERQVGVVLGDTAQSAIYAKMAQLASRYLNDPVQAVKLWQSVLDHRGEDPEALNALGDIYAVRENWKDLVDVLDREVAAVDDDGMRVAIYADLGRIWYEKLNRDRNALENWERVLDIEPANTSALFAMAEIYRGADQTQELVDTLNRVIEVGEESLPAERVEAVHMQLGELYRAALSQPVDAIDSYNRALEVNPTNFEAMEALESIHRTEEMWEDAIQVMERRVLVLSEPVDQVEQLMAIAAMWAAEASQPDAGTSAYQRVLEIEPLHDVAFTQLEELHGAAERWEDLIELYIQRVEATEETGVRVSLLCRIASVYEEKLGDPNQAYDALHLAWTEDWANKETALELERVTRDTNKWNELLTAANEALGEVEAAEDKIAICLQCARWYGQELGKQEYAIPYIQQIDALDPGNVPAKQQLAELYRYTQQWQQLAAQLYDIVQFTSDRPAKADTYVQLGQLCIDELGKADDAPTYFLQALEEDQHHVGALEALERIYEPSEDWHKLLDVLERKVEALRAQTPGEGEDALRTQTELVARAQLQVADTFEVRFQDADKAIEAYHAVLSVDDVNLDALRGLERLYAQRERWQELLEVLEKEYEVVETEKGRVQILLRLAGMWEEEFLKPEKAAERLEQVLELDPNHSDALAGLARLYKQLQAWEQLIATYERWVSATADRNERGRIFRALGETYSQELDDTDRGVDAYLNALDIEEDDLEALDALTRLYDKRGDHGAALEMMEKIAALTSEPEQVVDLRFRMGRILDEELGDRVAATEHYQAAIDLNPGHLESLSAIRRIYADSGEWDAAARFLEQESQFQNNPRLVSKLLVELGVIYEDKLEDHERAVQVFEAAFAQDGDNPDAALPLCREYYSQERFDDALPLLQLLAKRKSKGDEDEHELSFMLGTTATRLGQNDEAIRAFSRAHEADAQHLPSLLGLAVAYYQSCDWDQAFRYHQMLLVHHRESLEADDTTEIFFRLGVIKREQGERRKALNMFDKALEENPEHRPTLEAFVGLYREESNWEQVIHYKKLILDVTEEEDAQFALLNDIGDLWKEKEGNLAKAIQMYSDAAAIKPEDHKTLHKLLIAYQETKQWELAIDAIQQISDLDERPVAKAKYAYTIAVIIRDELKDPERAIDKFNEALDSDPEQLKPFEAINKLLTQKKDWKQLERAFRKMLHRIVGRGQAELEFNLWHNLGVIYRDRQKKFENAAEAFKMASNLKPELKEEHQILAELYAVIPDRLQDAIDEHQWMLQKDPYEVDSYRALYKLYFDAREYDKAWCLAATLTFLKKADEEQQKFYEQYKVGGMIRPQSRLDNERWVKDVFHPSEDLYVSKMMQAMAAAVHGLKKKSDKSLHLVEKYRVADPAASTVTFARTYGFVAQVMNLDLVPRLYLRTDTPGGIVHISGSAPPASVCGSTLLSGYNPLELTFVIARHLTYYRQEHFSRTVMTSHTELGAVLLAGLRIAGVLQQSDAKTDQLAKQLAPLLNPTQTAALRAVAKKFVEAGAVTDMKKWVQAVELSGCRAGFLLTSDLETTARMIQSLPPEGASDLAPKDKIKEVVLFSVSEEYFRLRKALGITISV